MDLETSEASEGHEEGKKYKMNYNDGWDPDRLEEEMAKHPFFMTEFPPEGAEVPPLIEALQQLKYSETDNTPHELAIAHKEDGNFHFKLKKYRIAITCFTEALKTATKTDDNNLIAQLYNNRSAAHFFLENFRSSLLDSQKALEIDPKYFKPLLRGIQAAIQLKNTDVALALVKRATEIEPMNSEVQRLKFLALRTRIAKESKDRREEIIAKQKILQTGTLMKTIEERGIKCKNYKFLTDILHTGGFGSEERVKLNNATLIWPVLFYYPQFSESELVKEFDENSTFLDHLITMLDEDRPSWDVKGEYTSENVTLAFVDSQTGAEVKVEKTATLKETLSNPKFELPRNGIPGFIVLAKGNAICDFLKERMEDASS